MFLFIHFVGFFQHIFIVVAGGPVQISNCVGDVQHISLVDNHILLFVHNENTERGEYPEHRLDKPPGVGSTNEREPASRITPRSR